MRKDIVVIGLGNPLMSDEGIGVRLIESLSEPGGRWPGVDFVDGGTGGMSVLHQLADRRKAVLIDCAFMGAEAGTIKKFRPDEVESSKVLAHHSLHEADLLKILEMSEQLGQGPEEVVIFGIEPFVVEQGMGLSKILEKRLDYYVSVIVEELD